MPNSKISLVFCGTDAFAVTVLERLLDDEQFEVLGTLVPPDAPVGRKRELMPCLVKVLAEERGLPVFCDPNELKGQSMDFLIVVSYGRIFSQKILDIPNVAALNVHGSLLPKYRGASPIATAILNGDDVTGVTVMKMVQKMDAGPICAVAEVVIEPDDTEPVLRQRMAHVGAELLAQVMPGIANGTVEPEEQDDAAATFSHKIGRQDGLIDWENGDADQIDRKRRAYTPWPGIFTHFEGKRLKILNAHMVAVSVEAGAVVQENGQILVGAQKGALALLEVQLEGKGPMAIDDFVRGYTHFVGAHLE